MAIMSIVIIVAVVLFAALIVALFFTQPKQANPPAQVKADSPTDGMPISHYNHEAGENIASPFAEQIEDILIAKLQSDPALAQYKLDLGTAADGGLDIWVNGKKYQSINDLPDEALKQAFREAVKHWDEKK